MTEFGCFWRGGEGRGGDLHQQRLGKWKVAENRGGGEIRVAGSIRVFFRAVRVHRVLVLGFGKGTAKMRYLARSIGKMEGNAAGSE